jgi:D-3-phosphoglycerate dehydrogenase
LTRKIVVAEELVPAGIAALSQGYEVINAAGCSRAELIELLTDAAALVVRSGTQVTAELIGGAPKLEVVGRAGVGVDNIDIAAATAAGVLVVNAPDANTISAAEHTFGLLLAQARNIGRAQVSMREGGWDRKALKGVELHGKTLGVIGLGRIGQLVTTRAVAFGMTVIAYDPYVSAAASGELGASLVELDELFDRSDFITIHLPKTPETTNLISSAAIAKMKDGVRIVNTSRGGIVDEVDLVEAVLAGKVASAGLDVYETEPLDPKSPLRSSSNIVLTPHLGASTIEAQNKAGVQVAEAVTRALAGEIVHSAVNIPVTPIGL